ncbi:hypothetical protein H3146_22775 [Streptomyces sp. OF3]|uniref:Uncharacterized protein n=1 Tax=Streptomyces alkaliterrae TaxID=2213162 RepID=A0A7W3WPY1_9ACTN|nr:hypothetical protein [Streptomyces alkaliterrae]MBB1256160.1 hypothetical protein [Streptomyces alkaliterrae]
MPLPPPQLRHSGDARTAWCGEGPREIVDWLEEEYGEITEAEREAGRAEPAEIGAGDERRRSARRPRRG